MKPNLTHCKLCGHDVPPEHVHKPRANDLRDVVDYTIRMIRSRHPEWTENDPACRKCWDYYQQL